MKLIGKLLLTLLLLLLLAVVLFYVALQTRWASGWISRWVNDNSEYHLSLDQIEHSWSSPAELTLYGVKWGQKNQLDTLLAKRVILGFSIRQITEPRYFHRLRLQDGTLNLGTQTAGLPIRADVLQLTNMALNTAGNEWQIDGQRVNAGIQPWTPLPGYPLGSNAHFQLSAGALTLNGISASQVLIQGQVQNQQLVLEDFGADVAQGQLTGSARRAADGSWMVDNLRLSNVRLQTPYTLREFWQRFTQLPAITLKRFDLIDARLEGKNWAFNDLALTLQNITLQHGSWRSSEGTLAFNASDLINGSVHFIDPIVSLTLSENGATIKQLTTRWEGGLLRTSGSWTQENQRLQLNELVIAGLEYTLPVEWRQLWQKPLPSWLAELMVDKLTANRNLLIDINPIFPFQITALDGTANNLLLVRSHQWGLWEGRLTLNASDATFNKIDVRRPSLALEASDRQIALTDLSAFTKQGMLEASVTLSQQPERAFSLALTGRSVPADILHSWGWPASSALQGNSNLQLQLQGRLSADAPLKPTVSAQLQIIDGYGQQITQQMRAGKVIDNK